MQSSSDSQQKLKCGDNNTGRGRRRGQQVVAKVAADAVAAVRLDDDDNDHHEQLAREKENAGPPPPKQNQSDSSAAGGSATTKKTMTATAGSTSNKTSAADPSNRKRKLAVFATTTTAETKVSTTRATAKAAGAGVHSTTALVASSSAAANTATAVDFEMNEEGGNNSKSSDIELTPPAAEQQVVEVSMRENRAEIRVNRESAKVKSRVLSNAADFAEIVHFNTPDTLADNTMFLEHIVKERNSVGFFFPRRFCKTTLLSMTDFLLSIHMDEKQQGLPLKNQWTAERQKFRKKFSHSSILTVPDFEENILGRFVCIRMSLQCSDSKTYAAFEQQFLERFSALFTTFAWLRQFLPPEHLDIFDRLKQKRATQTDLHYALSHLASWLQAHFLNLFAQEQTADFMDSAGYSRDNFKKILIILDNCDHILHPRIRSSPSASTSERNQMVEFFDNLMDITFKTTTHIRGIVAGYYPTAHWVSERFRPYHVLDAGKYAEFFGFSERAFNHLCGLFNVNEEDKKSAKSWYNGYTVYGLHRQKFRAYNPQNVIQFLENRKEEPGIPFNPLNRIVLTETFDVKVFADLFQRPCIAKRIETLLDPIREVELKMQLIWPLNASHVEQLKKAANDPGCDLSSEELANLFFTFLLYAGYIDAKEQSTETAEFTVTVPNLLHKRELAELIAQNYYRQLFKPFYPHVPAAQTALQNFYKAASSCEEDGGAKLKEKMEAFRHKCNIVLAKMPELSNIKEWTNEGGEAVHPNEDVFHSLFNCMVLALCGVSIFGTEVKCTCTRGDYAEKKEEEVRSDTSFADFAEKTAVQIEHKYDKTVQEALRQSVDYRKIFTKHLAHGCVERILFVGINFRSDKTLEIKYFLDKNNDKASETRLGQIRDRFTGEERRNPDRAAKGGNKNKNK